MKKENIYKLSKITGCTITYFFLIVAASYSTIYGQDTTIFHEDSESGIGNWFADNGLWEVGIPTSGPESAHSGQQVAGTVLDGNFHASANTRLISPGVLLPSFLPGEKIQLKFWHWYRFSDDNGSIQISVNGGDWKTISDPLFDGTSTNWTQKVIDLSAFSDSTVRIAFYFVSNSNSAVDNGWYVDDISIEKKEVPFNNPENFELGVGDWSADNGLWEVGTPTAGPESAHSGQQVAGTVLDGNFHASANTRLISPSVLLPTFLPGEKIQLKFWHWYRFSDDNGSMQISVNGGDWKTISEPLFDGTSTNWTQKVIDLSAYSDSTIRIAFYFVSNSNSAVDNGWYVDDIRIEKKEAPFNNPEDFELGVGDWSADNGLWEVGTPPAGPESAHSGQQVAGTVLDGNFHASANTRLISPEVTLVPLPGQVPMLFFWHWYRFSDDNGRIQISVNGGDWETISEPLFDGTSTTWTQYAIDLSAYSDSTIRIAFYFVSNSNSAVDNGWYVDDIRIENIEAITTSIDEGVATNLSESTLLQNYPNPFTTSTTISYQLRKSGNVELTIYNSLGQKLKTLVNKTQPTGDYQVAWEAKSVMSGQVRSGVYWYSLRVGSKVQIKKMVFSGS